MNPILTRRNFHRRRYHPYIRSKEIMEDHNLVGGNKDRAGTNFMSELKTKNLPSYCYSHRLVLILILVKYEISKIYEVTFEYQTTGFTVTTTKDKILQNPHIILNIKGIKLFFKTSLQVWLLQIQQMKN